MVTWMGAVPLGNYTPSPTDPATLGALLGLVRERWGRVVFVVGDDAGDFWLLEEARDNHMRVVPGTSCHEPTEFAALLAALIAGAE